VLGSVAEDEATSTPGSISDIMQSPMASAIKPISADEAGMCVCWF